MKKLYLTLLFIIPVVAIHAQGNILHVEPREVVKEISVDGLKEGYQDVTTLTITNRSQRTLQILPKYNVDHKPDSWKYGIFENQSQNTPFKLRNSNSQFTGQLLSLLPGSSAKYFVVLEPGGNGGNGVANVSFVDMNSPGTPIATAKFITSIKKEGKSTKASATNDYSSNKLVKTRPTPTHIRLYPNPAKERFFVEGPPNFKIGRIEISNALGRRLLSFQADEGREGYDIETLPQGLYMVSIYDNTGQKVKTLRLLHRRFGA